MTATQARINTVFWFAARVFVGVVYTYSGWSKAVDPVENFEAVIAAYELLPFAVIPVIAYTLPWVELVLGVFMLVGYIPKWSALGLGFLSFSFMSLIGLKYLLSGELPADCGCFGEGSLIQLTPNQVFFLDLANVFLALGIFRQKCYPLSLEELLRKRGERERGYV